MRRRRTPAPAEAQPLTVPLVTTSRAAELLGGLSPRTLERWRVEGRGPRFLRVGGRVMYDPRDLAAFPTPGGGASAQAGAADAAPAGR